MSRPALGGKGGAGEREREKKGRREEGRERASERASEKEGSVTSERRAISMSASRRFEGAHLNPAFGFRVQG
jgi:hypothetical protein